MASVDIRSGLFGQMEKMEMKKEEMAMNRKSAVNMLLVLGAAVAMGTEAWGKRRRRNP